MTRSYSGYLLDWVVGRCGETVDGFVGADHGPIVVFDAPRLGGTSVDVVISDRIPGQRVTAVVNQTGRPWAGRIVCGRTAQPLPVREGKPIFVHLFDGVSDGGPSVLSGGTVTATFYRGQPKVERQRSGSR